MRVLIAEDDPVSRMILKRSVEMLGHGCLAVEDGQKAWELFQKTPEVDVIISDWMMPEVDGLELCARVREREHHGDVDGLYTFFVFLTALGDKEHLLEGMRAGADDYLSKPLDRDDLQVRLLAAERMNALHRRLHNLNAKLFASARRDPLTGVANRLQLREDLKALDARARRYGHGFCAVICDVDSFKAYNDAHGHQAGDKVLERVANVISERLRAGDTVYRYGGEEFLVILPEQDEESGRMVAERLRHSVEELAIAHESRTPPGAVVSVSVGLAALTPGEKRTFEDLLKEADEALYRAKEGGKNRVETGGSLRGNGAAGGLGLSHSRGTSPGL